MRYAFLDNDGRMQTFLAHYLGLPSNMVTRGIKKRRQDLIERGLKFGVVYKITTGQDGAISVVGSLKHTRGRKYAFVDKNGDTVVLLRNIGIHKAPRPRASLS